MSGSPCVKSLFKTAKAIKESGIDVTPESIKGNFKETKSFSGGKVSFESKIKLLKKTNVRYKVSTYGSVCEISYDDSVQRHIGESTDDKKLGAACLRVIRLANKYTKEHGALESKKRSTQYKDSDLFYNFLIQGEREYYDVDIKACYWNVAYDAGILDEKTYEEFKDEKGLRNHTLGNLKKKRVTYDWIGGTKLNHTRIEELNPNAWVWDYIVSRVWEVFEYVNSKIKDGVFMFKTDCFTVSKRDYKKVLSLIKKMGLECRSKKYVVVGYSGKFIKAVNEYGEECNTSFRYHPCLNGIIECTDTKIKID